MGAQVHSVARRLRIELNRAAVVSALLLALPHVALVGRLRGATAGYRAARRWVRRGARLTGLRFTVAGAVPPENGRRRLLVANHSSPIDIASLVAVLDDVRFVPAADLFRVPLLAAAMRALGAVPVDRRSGTGRLVLTGRDRPAGNIAVFPEGGIAPAGARLAFRRGAFAMAIEEQMEVVPVAIHHSARRLPPRGRLAVRPGEIFVEFLPPLPTAGLGLDDRRTLCDQAEQAILAALGPSDGGTGAGISR